MTVNSFGPSGPLKNKLPVLLAWISQVFDAVFLLLLFFFRMDEGGRVWPRWFKKKKKHLWKNGTLLLKTSDKLQRLGNAVFFSQTEHLKGSRFG